MKSIVESLQNDVQSLSSFIESQIEYQEIDEGLKDIMKGLVAKFKKVVQYFRNFVARIGKSSYWIPVSDNGELIPAISSLTAAQAYADGNINKATTVVAINSRGAAATGCNGKISDIDALYGSGDSRDYWKRILKESMDDERKPLIEERRQMLNDMVNEVKMANTDPHAKYNVVDTPKLKDWISKAITGKLGNKRLLIYGAPGIGKTAILKALKKEMNLGSDYTIIAKTLSNETPENFTLPKYVIDEQGMEKATDIPKTWMPLYKPTNPHSDKLSPEDEIKSEACGRGLLFIDELSRAQPQVLNIVLPLINEGEFNGWKLGKNWTIIAASNRMEDELSGQAEIGNALSNRFLTLYYEPTVNSWSEWAKTEDYMSPLLLQWLKMPEHENLGGGKYFYWDPNDDGSNDDPSKLMCTPRSWTNAMQTLAVFADTGKLEGYSILDIDRDIIAMALNSCIPAEAVDSFLAFLAIINEVGDFEKMVKSIWDDGGKGWKLTARQLQKVAIQISQLIVTYHANSFPTADEFNNLAEWVCDQNSDQLCSYMMDILMNVYASDIPEKRRAAMFRVRELTDKEPNKAGDYYMAMKTFFDKWGFRPENMPDLSAGFKKLGKKFGPTFADPKYMIDGQSALG